MKTVDVLCDDSQKLSCGFKFRELFVCRIRFHVEDQHFVLIKTIELFGIANKKRVADDLLRRILVLQIVETVL